MVKACGRLEFVDFHHFSGKREDLLIGEVNGSRRVGEDSGRCGLGGRDTRHSRGVDGMASWLKSPNKFRVAAKPGTQAEFTPPWTVPLSKPQGAAYGSSNADRGCNS